MSYFRELPDIEYQSYLLHKISSREFVRVKNFFRRVKLQDFVQDNVTVFDKYTILEGQRPDTVAEVFYGSSDLDWIVVLTAEITNIKDQWPLSNYDLYRYVENKYGTTLNDIHHYETVQIIDERGRLILPGGQIVDENFKIPAPYDSTLNSNSYTAVGAYENTQYSGTGDINPVIGVSNWEYETQKNEKKRQIFLMKPIYLQQYLNEMRQIMNYKESSQYIDKKLIRTENTRLVGP
jgi:hypothetical protein